MFLLIEIKSFYKLSKKSLQRISHVILDNIYIYREREERESFQVGCCN